MGLRPQTLYALADSPVGLAAWMLDYGDGGGQPAAGLVSGIKRTTSDTVELTRDEILDNVTVNRLTNMGRFRRPVSTGSTRAASSTSRVPLSPWP
jgi:hypothetical protein